MRFCQAAAALRHTRGLPGHAKVSEPDEACLTNRRRWLRDPSSRQPQLPMGSGITEAACKIGGAPRRKRSGMAWTQAGGQGEHSVILTSHRGALYLQQGPSLPPGTRGSDGPC